MIEKVNDECLENVSGGKIYYVVHEKDCRFGYRCSLKMFPLVVTRGNIPIQNITLKDILICEDFDTALITELELNREMMNPNENKATIDPLLHDILERRGICAQWTDTYE